jgi:hypothetical protein
VNRAIALSAEFNELPGVRSCCETLRTGLRRSAILGFEKGQPVRRGDRWTSTYVPATLARGPFSLGYIRAEDANNLPAGIKAEMKVMIDDQHPRLRADGQPVFLPLGGESPYLEGIKRVLQTVDAGLRVDLFSAVGGSGSAGRGEVPDLVPLSCAMTSAVTTLSIGKLAALGGDHLLRLHRLGLLGRSPDLLARQFSETGQPVARLQSA